MSIAATRFAWELDLSNEKKRSTKRLVLLALADRANNDGVCFPSIARLCQDTCLDRKTVMTTINDLIELGTISDTGERKGATKQVRVLQINIVDNSKNTTSKQCEISQTTVPNLLNKSAEFPLNSTKNGTRNLKESNIESKIESLDVKIENENVLTTSIELDETTLLLIEEQAHLEGKSTQEVADQYLQATLVATATPKTQNKKQWIPKDEYKAMKQAEFKQQQNKEMCVSKAMQESFKQGFGNPNATKGIPADVLKKLPSFLKKRIR